MPQPVTHSIATRLLVSVLGVLLVSVAILAFFAYVVFMASSPAETPLAESIRIGEAPRPAVTEENTIKSLSKTKPFSALVSYTDQGFEPRTVTVRNGDVVRFTNNSSGDIQLRTESDTSCKVLSPQQFCELTFSSNGSVSVMNVMEIAQKMVVTVR